MKRIPGLCPDCPVQTGYSQHSPGQTLFLLQKVTLGKRVNNIVAKLYGSVRIVRLYYGSIAVALQPWPGQTLLSLEKIMV